MKIRLSLVHRPHALTIPDKNNYQGYIESITHKELNLYIIKRTILMFGKFLFFDFLIEFLLDNEPEIPERLYILRIFDYFVTGHQIISLYNFFYCNVYLLLTYVTFSFGWDVQIILFGIILNPLLFIKNNGKQSEENKSYITRIKEWLILTTYITRIKEWLILTIFHTKPLVDKPFLSTSPRDFWSNRWHSIYRECFRELFYYPVRNFFKFNRNIGYILGILLVYFISGILHDYIYFISFAYAESYSTGRGRNVKDSLTVKIFKIVIFLSVLSLTAPWNAEPLIRVRYIEANNTTRIFSKLVERYENWKM
ncbi:12979_t:CDS:2 [Dentiscutata erythropus]|uniref:12979_t:CDS:1 n=1 Tax=Dentiscutata erythropus TaxID=1348616 RepID=A0A9N9H1V0_9GLOM|nr:12979_t:CDS:2 [Dentiscutata erythropus]